MNVVYSKNNFGEIFVKAIRKAIDTTLLICGIVVIFLMLSTIIVHSFNFSDYNAMIIKGFFEVTIGIQAVSKLPLNAIFKAVSASMFLAFGGISVHIQVLSQITDTDIKYIYFFVGRMYQMIISGILTYTICLVLGI